MFTKGIFVRNLLISIVILSFSFPSIASEENSASVQIADMYDEFNIAMGKFQATKMPVFVLEKHYYRVSQNYLKHCKAEFDNYSGCEIFNKPFDAWYFINGGGKICKIHGCIVNQK